MLRLQIIVVSTRPGRKGPAVATWFEQRARAHGAFEVEVVDLAEVALPVFDEPEHPRLRKYQHEHTKRWSAIVERGDAYVFVTPEYNFSAPPSLLNALDFLYTEWAEKPAGFVSYGGVSGGLRGVQMAKQVLTSLGVMPIVAGVAIPFFATRLGPDGAFASDEKLDGSAAALLTDLARWAGALASMRASRG
ncbi:reductase [Luteitalea sp. TBR-22]|uniref:NADPH-dependent FMN reductase n=1 Tax=Luteitalea sp. TBR-22 TaxID=2802971 RepID=UPI001AF869E9|nr:NAD(P)H-dependent oxidoreductase [Luteitalea sp. TBR-22]BCS31932.1 reductase [Luteitalea sp. TBR-22]